VRCKDAFQGLMVLALSFAVDGLGCAHAGPIDSGETGDDGGSSPATSSSAAGALGATRGTAGGGLASSASSGGSSSGGGSSGSSSGGSSSGSSSRSNAGASSGSGASSSTGSGSGGSSGSSGVGGSSGSSGVGDGATDLECWLEDDGSDSGNRACVETCCQGAYPPGSSDFFQDVAGCLCAASGPCASLCGGGGDYCSSPGSVATNQCEACLDTYLAPGAACDPTVGDIATACAADPDCAAYTACTDGCP
jgi:hypothetical protein